MIVNNVGSKELQPNLQYEAIVVDENDPRKLGRVRARVLKFMDGIPDESLPWARPATWNHPEGLKPDGNSVQRSGSFGGVPKRGSRIHLNFPTANPYVCTWTSNVPYDDKSKLPEFLRNYPNRLGIKMANGMTVIIDSKTNEMYLICPGDFHQVIFGDVNQSIIGNQQLIVSGDKGEIPSYLLNDPHMVVGSLSPNPQGRIKFKGLLGSKPGSQHTSISGHQTTIVKGNRKDVIEGDYSIETRKFTIKAKAEVTVNGRRVNLGRG